MALPNGNLPLGRLPPAWAYTQSLCNLKCLKFKKIFMTEATLATCHFNLPEYKAQNCAKFYSNNFHFIC